MTGYTIPKGIARHRSAQANAAVLYHRGRVRILTQFSGWRLFPSTSFMGYRSCHFSSSLLEALIPHENVRLVCLTANSSLLRCLLS